MDILGIGPLELIFILIIILIVMGPKDIVKSSRVVGKFLRSVMTHPTFRLVQDTSREIRNLPYRLAREAGVEDLQNDLKSYTDLPSISPFETEGDKGKTEETEQVEPGLGSWEKAAPPPAGTPTDAEQKTSTSEASDPDPTPPPSTPDPKEDSATSDEDLAD